MVSFQTAEIYNEDNDNIIGVKVFVSADTGQVIDEIQVTNKTEFEALEARLDSLGDDYVQHGEDSPLSGETIDDILANVSETININALTLGGIQSDGYAKTSHTHQKSSITNLYNYDIGCSNYNLKLNGTSADKTTTVSVKVTNMSNSPVNGHSVIIYKDGEVWVNGTTNAQGIFSSTFTADTPGIVTFKVNNQKVQCHVKGWKIVSSTVGTLRVNEELRLVNFYGQVSKTMPNANTDYLLGTIPSEYAPLFNIRQLGHNDISGPRITYVKVSTNGNVNAISSINHTGTLGVSWNFMWSY